MSAVTFAGVLQSIFWGRLSSSGKQGNLRTWLESHTVTAVLLLGVIIIYIAHIYRSTRACSSPTRSRIRLAWSHFFPYPEDDEATEQQRMTIHLTPEQERRLRAVLDRGAYKSVEEVVEAALTPVEQRTVPGFAVTPEELDTLLAEGLASK
jgi:Arc/MetJ-type ribon-helix-helix transcriptional regulator